MAYQSVGYLMELIQSSQLKSESEAMCSLMGSLSVARGRDFNRRVGAALEEALGRPSRLNVENVAGHRINREDGQQAGDIDVLTVDIRSHVIWAVECKAIARSRMPHEIASELWELVGHGGHRGLLDMHERRLVWLDANLPAVVAELKLNDGPWRLQGAFVVDSDLLGPYLQPTRIPVLTAPGLLDAIAGSDHS